MNDQLITPWEILERTLKGLGMKDEEIEKVKEELNQTIKSEIVTMLIERLNEEGRAKLKEKIAADPSNSGLVVGEFIKNTYKDEEIAEVTTEATDKILAGYVNEVMVPAVNKAE
jgi:hypothetical protein